MANRTRSGVRVARWLVGGTLAYNVVEAVVALASGTRAESIALVGFGLDSVIECAAAGVLLWRLGVESGGADPETIEASERRVRRFVGITFLALALYVLAESGWSLYGRSRAAESPIGIALAVASLIVMPILSLLKLREASRIGSQALRAEAKETLACAYLSAALLLGLVANAAAGWWWADPVAALLMVPWLVKEGIEGLRGDGCCC
jgi:divalent metal cation (Fe/Co/Zn/Cd) transporter